MVHMEPRPPYFGMERNKPATGELSHSIAPCCMPNKVNAQVSLRPAWQKSKAYLDSPATLMGHLALP